MLIYSDPRQYVKIRSTHLERQQNLREQRKVVVLKGLPIVRNLHAERETFMDELSSLQM